MVVVRIFKVQDGQLWVWDDSPADEWGQVWMPVCPGCGGGPLDRTDGLVCGECGALEHEHID